ncbi:CCA tRNA nucleotidyltransferase [Prochlorococcus marinus]|uniref:tRNA nucleotidyltransferase n=1 Tax=Prochlorococcus marinus XMU1408 TaxID=2213228 RepID=A0A318QZC4_PROMR|nr:CCA tRNA nucleotidyltransferase [Prochlorococcus marinus]MBW3041360.1 tRNA nucleotidyltransferase [Prochlorococcus marinus str. XMU1408]PYE02526.1 tRNA nucleotidyltransferase [Prochlorococcus marinus XMU1408]
MELFNNSKIEKEIKELPDGILSTLLYTANSINIKSVAIVGGIVRDLITKSKNKNYDIIFNDLDLIIEGDTTKYIKELMTIIGPDRVKIIRNNTTYKTSEITIDDIKVDIASAREETYPIPGENPLVELSTIKNDLTRRDFNINSMAIELKDNKIIDLFSGLDAIENMSIDFLHESSVLDDPTRIIRASRYAAKLNFNLSNKALKQIQNTIHNWPWNWRIGDKPDLAPSALSTRLKMELELLFKSKDWVNAIKNLQEWGGLKIIDSKLQNDQILFEKILVAKNSNIEPLTAFVYEAENPLYLSERLQLAQSQKEIIQGAYQLNKYLKNIQSKHSYKDWSPSKWTTFLEEINIDESSFILEICRKSPFKEYLSSWLYNWKNIESPIKGNDLIEKGWKSGQEIGIEIKRQRMKLIDEQNSI